MQRSTSRANFHLGLAVGIETSEALARKDRGWRAVGAAD
jgi:hypothetical protein